MDSSRSWRKSVFFATKGATERKVSSAPVETHSRCQSVLVNVRNEILDFLAEQIPAQSLAGLKASNEARRRVWTLFAKEKESGLIPEEILELDDYLKLENLVVPAKTKSVATKHG